MPKYLLNYDLVAMKTLVDFLQENNETLKENKIDPKNISIV